MDRRTAVAFWLIPLGLLAACAHVAPTLPPTPPEAMARIAALLPADALLIGEQHDAPEHQRVHQDVVAWLAGRGTLAAVALEMADAGTSTAGLPRDATQVQVQAALHWATPAWPWAPYAPAVMAAVRAGVPVLGANLPRSEMRDAMQNIAIEDHLTGDNLRKQQENIRHGHCGQLPESQIAPMTRIQLARDQRMAQTVVLARQPGKTVVLLAGGGHVRRDLGVPVFLPPTLVARVVALQAGAQGHDPIGAGADLSLQTAAVPPKDYCASLRKAG